MPDNHPQPRVDERGVPWCITKCQNYRESPVYLAYCNRNMKPCRTGQVCQPAVAQLAADLATIRRVIGEITVKRTRYTPFYNSGWNDCRAELLRLLSEAGVNL